MPRKNSYLTVTDQFCGAGGSSQGIRNLSNRMKGGLEIKLALNHWKLAIETHNTNFPDTMHDCTDISAADPRRYFSTDILITSPECTNHSLAKGKKQVRKQMDMFANGELDPAAERSRATMWDVPRFAEYHNYNLIITENVVDARKWVMWDAWILAMKALGYEYKEVYLNSMFCHPTPQSRDRLYVMFWKKGNKAPDMEFRPSAYCPKCGKNIESMQVWKNPAFKWGKYKRQYTYNCPVHGIILEPYYYAAFNAINWSDFGTRIGDRPKKLCANTEKRIRYGLEKYGSEPLLITTGYSSGLDCRVRVARQELPTQPSDYRHGILTPFIVDDKHHQGISCRVRNSNEPINTIHTDPRLKIILPFIIKGEHTKAESGGKVKSVKEPFQTQTTRQTFGLLTPMIAELNRTGKSRKTTEPLSTILANGNHHGLITDEAFQSFIGYYYSNFQASMQTEPLGTAKTHDTHFLINYQTPNYEDCYYRMLKPGEIKKGMAFPDTYEIKGSGKDQVCQSGNAVTPPAMDMLAERGIQTFN